MNSTELRIEMLRHNDTGKTLADALGITRTTLSAKTHGKNAEFTQKEIMSITKRYELTPERVNEIFFAK